MQLIGKTKIDFIGMRKISFIISGIISIIGIIAIVQIARGAANMGIDFSGGTSLQIKFAKPFTTDEVRKALADNGIKEVDLQEIKDGNQLLIKMRKSTAPVGKIAETIEQDFKKALPG